MNINNEDTIDLTKLWEIVREKKIVIIGMIVFCLIISTIIAYMMPKTYKSTALIRVKTTNVINENLSNYVNPDIYLGLMKSRKITNNIISKLDSNDMEKYNLLKNNISTVEFVNIKNTDLITISTSGRRPEDAQFVTQTVVSNLGDAIQELNELQKDELVIQVIDNATLPDINNPDKPNKKIIIAIGLVISMMIGFGYSLYIYSRRYGL